MQLENEEGTPCKAIGRSARARQSVFVDMGAQFQRVVQMETKTGFFGYVWATKERICQYHLADVVFIDSTYKITKLCVSQYS